MKVFSAAAAVATATLVSTLSNVAARGADRVVLCEEFTNFWCTNCGIAGPALSMLLDTYPDSFAFVQYHVADEHALPWSDTRWNFYVCQYTPTAVFDGVDRYVGSVNQVPAQYRIYRTLHFLPELAMPTDVTIGLSVQDLGGAAYRVEAAIGLEPSGTAKALRIYLVQVLDHWPTTRPYYRNGFKQAADTQDIWLEPGQTQVVSAVFALDDDSIANLHDVKFIVWAQHPENGFPAYVYQAAVRGWPLVTVPGDYDADGVPDAGDNCPRRYNPGQEDGDGDGIGDSCDNCPAVPNVNQADADDDRVGDVCDNCPAMHYLGQDDSDADGRGDACDSCPEVPAPAGVDSAGRPLGAIDLDCDVDEADLAFFAGCMAGPGAVPPSGCDAQYFARADVDADGDVDLADLALISRNFTGSLAGPAMYVGVTQCLSCHAANYSDWIHTRHATAFDTLIQGGNQNNELCFPCHTVGYGAASGFVSQETTPHLTGVQCETCHGAGSSHATDPYNVAAEVRLDSAACGACHESCHGLCGENHHPQFEQWSTSAHSRSLYDLWWTPGAADYCLACHSTDYRLAAPGQEPSLWTAQFNIECAACHRAHGSPYVGQLRQPPYLLCADCHRMGELSPGDPPDQPQAEMLHGTGGFRLDGTPQQGPYSMHWWGIADECKACHVYMQPYGGPHQPVDSGHTFRANLRSCMPCHTEQTASLLVRELEYEISTRLGEIAHYFTPGDPLYLDPATLPIEELPRYLVARFNYEMVREDRSYGTHNPPYARTLLAQTESFLGIEPWPRGRGGGSPARLEEKSP